MRPSIYLDYNATQPIKPAVRDAMIEVLAGPANASSVHQLGQSARARVEQARAGVAALIGAEPGEILFTSGATEANNWVLSGFARPLVSALEHPSIRNVPGVEFLPATAEGIVDLTFLSSWAKAQDPSWKKHPMDSGPAAGMTCEGDPSPLSLLPPRGHIWPARQAEKT